MNDVTDAKAICEVAWIDGMVSLLDDLVADRVSCLIKTPDAVGANCRRLR